MDRTKLDQADLNSPCRELSSGGLGFVAALLIFREIMFLCVHCDSGLNPAVTYFAVRFKKDKSTKNLNFLLTGLKTPRKWPQCYNPWRKLQKGSHTVFILCLGYNSRKRNDTSVQHSQFPIKRNKNAPPPSLQL